MKDNKWIIAVINDTNGINLHPRLGENPAEHRWTWIPSNIAKMMDVREEDIAFRVDKDRNLSIEEAEEAIIGINEELNKLDEKHTLEARRSWVARFNDQ